MLNFTRHIPTKFVFGRGVENQTGAEVKALGATRVLLHYGGGSAVRSGLIGRVEASLKEAGVPYVTLGGAQPNPRDTKVYEGIEIIRREGLPATVVVASDHFHQLRAGIYAARNGLDARSLGCPSVWFLGPGYWAREVLALYAAFIRGY